MVACNSPSRETQKPAHVRCGVLHTTTIAAVFGRRPPDDDTVDADDPVVGVVARFVLYEERDRDAEVWKFRQRNGTEPAVLQGADDGVLSDRGDQRLGRKRPDATPQLEAVLLPIRMIVSIVMIPCMMMTGLAVISFVMSAAR